MAANFPRYNYLISKYHPNPPCPLPPHPANLSFSRTLDPVFAIFIGVSAAGIRIRREENEKRAGLPTSAMVKSTDGRIDGEGEVGFEEIARVGWGRAWRAVKGEVVGDDGG